MKKTILLLGFISLISLSSCFYQIPEPADMMNRMIEEQGYDKVYSFSHSSTYLNSLAPKQWQKNYYGNIYALYGKIDENEVFYVYGDDEMGEIFPPFIYEWPLKHNYLECLNYYQEIITYKEFNMSLEDNVNFITNTDKIEEILDDNIHLDNYFLLQCDGYHYLYESNGELNYKYFE